MATGRPDIVASEAQANRESPGISGCAVLGVPHGGLGEGIRSLLGTFFESVVLVADERSLLACLQGLRPELLVLDVALAPGRAFELTARLRAANAGLRLLLLVGDESPAMARAARDAGADGCLGRASLAADLVRAVEAVTGGGTAFWCGGGRDGGEESVGSGPASGRQRGSR